MSKWGPTPTPGDAGSPFSKLTLDLPSVDLSSWRGRRQDPPAFGSDISVIPKQNGLSLIPEGRDIERGDAGGKWQPSQKSRATLDERQSKSRHSNRSETYFYNGQYDDDSDAGGEFTADDVICDLRDLSMQIREQRRNTKSKRAYNQ